MHTINARGKLIPLDQPIVMGIINITEDSFYEGSRAFNSEAILAKAEQMLSEGATILDLGAMSTRPGVGELDAEVEEARLHLAIDVILTSFPSAILAVDTYRAAVARSSVERGAHIINDISGGSFDSDMYDVVASLGVPYIMMHLQGTPMTMHDAWAYDDVALEVIKSFINRVGLATKAGVKDIILDPGFGFSKNLDQNYELLRQLKTLSILDKPILAGISRKSMIYKTLGGDAASALNGTTALHTYSLLQGVKILRVHDVREAMECIRLFMKLSQ